MAQLTPADVRNVVFAKAPFGRRGYQEEQVDAFLADVAATIEALTREVAALRAQSGALPVEPADVGVSGAAEAVMLAELHEIKHRLSRLEAAAPVPAHSE